MQLKFGTGRSIVQILCLLFFLYSVFSVYSDNGAGTIPAGEELQKSITARIQTLTTMEKIGQLFILGLQGNRADREVRSLIQDYRIGGFVVSYRKSVEESAELMRQLQALSAVPLVIAADHESGACRRLPSNIPLPTNAAIGGMNDAAYAASIARYLGEELRRAGINVNLAPVLDINRYPGKGVIGNRSYGADPDVVARMGSAQIDGFRAAGVVPTAKHFPGHGTTLIDSHFNLPVVSASWEELDTGEIYPFRQAIARNIEIIMTGHLLIPALDPQFPATLSWKIITGLLREQYHFKGVVMSDCLSMRAITTSYKPETAALKFLEAGGDWLLIYTYILPDGTNLFKAAYAGITKAVSENRISMRRIDESLVRIFNLKYKIFGANLF